MKDAMSFPARLLALASLAAVLIAGLWLLARDSGPLETVPHQPTLAGLGEDSEVPTLAVPEADRDATQPARSVAPPRASEEKTLVIPDDAIWINGRVIFPPGTPSDEEVRIVARGRSFPGTNRRRTHEVDANPDGSFRVAFAPGTLTGSVWLEAHYLYVSGDFQFDAQDPPEQILLEPEVGGRLLVTVTLPLGSPPGDLDGIGMRAMILDSSRNMTYHARAVNEHEGSVFELPALAPGHSVLVSVSSPFDTDNDIEVEGLRARETREISLTLKAGVHLTGLIIDESGTPLRGARVYGQTVIATMGSDPLYESVKTQSNADGRFSFRGVKPGKIIVHAIHKGHTTASLELGVLQDGMERLDLVLSLTRGTTVAGRVEDDRGTPLEKFRVVLSESRLGNESAFDKLRHRDVARSFKSTDGTFELEDVPPGSWDAVATAGGHTPMKAVRVDVPHSGDLVLAVKRDATVSGVVVDPEGRPVERATVEAQRRLGRSLRVGTRLRRRSKADGSFRLTLTSGTHELHASHAGYADSDTLTLDVQPGEQRKGLLLTLRHPASISGTISSSEGNLADRRVELFHPDGSYLTSVRPDENRRFELQGLEPGDYQVVLSKFTVITREDGFTLESSARDWPPSQPSVVLALEAGQTLEITLGGTGDVSDR